MKILLTIDSLKFGGAQRVLTELANYFSSQGNKVYIIFFNTGEVNFNLNKKNNLVNLNINKANKVIFALRTSYFIRKSIKNINPDIILNFMFPSFFLTITYNLHYPIYISIRNNPKKIQKYDSKLFRKIIFKKAKRIIAQTNYAAEIIREQTQHPKIVVIPNPVKKINRLKANKKENIILNIGRLIKGKGHKDLIYIFSKVNPDNWKLVFVGDGPLRKELEEYATKLNIFKKISFEGYQRCIDKYLAKAKIFAFTSYSEGFPNALLEALAYPIPCISYDCEAGPSELIKDGYNGYLVPLGMKDEYIQKLSRLIKDEDIRKQFVNNSHSIKEKYSVENIGNKYLKLFKQDINA